jgi:hypothetical protein
MTLRPGSLIFLISAICACTAPTSSIADGPKQVTVYVDSVLAADTNEGMDRRLEPLEKKLHGLFSFTTYSLLHHDAGQTECGKMIAFVLPGGKILHIQPRAIDGDMIAMEIVMFDGTRPMMTTDLKLKNNGTLIVGGPRYEQGMLIITIGASTGVSHDATTPDAGTPAEAIVH